MFPSPVISELYDAKPSSAMLRTQSCTGGNPDGLERKGWVYEHTDEALEKQIFRHLKSLSRTLLTHLENSAACLMELFLFRSLARYVIGASCAFARITGTQEYGEETNLLYFYDRTLFQQRIVDRMLNSMCDCVPTFLSLAH